MAHAMFLGGREGFLSADIDWNAPLTNRVALVRGYTFNLAHRTIADFKAAGGVLVANQLLTSTTVTDAIADAADVTFPSVPAGDPITGLLIYRAPADGTGALPPDNQQRLIFFSNEYTNLPITPNGGDLVISWSNSPAGIFAL